MFRIIYFKVGFTFILDLNCFVFLQMILLRTKNEEERNLLEKRLEADIEAPKMQMTNMMKANIQAARKENEADVDQKKTLKNSIAEIQSSLDELSRVIECLTKGI